MLPSLAKFIIDSDAFLPMTDDNAIFAEIEALLEAAPPPELDEIEHTLTSGYAAALQLEGERLRIERRIGEIAGLVEDEERGTAKELAKLARRLTATDGDLLRLRSMLGTLRSRAQAARV